MRARAFAASENVLAGLRVLVVDDDDDSRESLRDLLNWFGASAEVASSAPEARRMIDETRPDVLVSDLSMPGEDGCSLLASIRARSDDRRDLPAVAVSAFVPVKGGMDPYAAGFQAVLGKPYELNDVVAAVARLAHQHRRQAPPSE
jgi:CheY-like chemotaxis protein